MSDTFTPEQLAALSTAVANSVISALKQVSKDEPKVDEGDMKKSADFINDVNGWEQRNIDANLDGCTTTRQINNLLQQVFYKGDVKTIVQLRQQARKEGGIRLANGLQRRAGVSFGVQLGNDFDWVQ